MSTLSIRVRFDCLGIMVTSTRRKLLVGSSVDGAENELSRLVENQSRQHLVRSSREELEFEAGQPKLDWRQLTGLLSRTSLPVSRQSRSFSGWLRTQRTWTISEEG